MAGISFAGLLAGDACLVTATKVAAIRCDDDPHCVLPSAGGEAPEPWQPGCVARAGCATARRDSLPPCQDNLHGTPLAGFLASPGSFQTDFELRGVVVARYPRCRYESGIPEKRPPGVCTRECQASLVLVPEGTQVDWPGVALRATNASRGIVLAARDGTGSTEPLLCAGDQSGTCCPLPLDGRPVVATFTRTEPSGTDSQTGDRGDLVLTRICRVGDRVSEPRKPS